MDHGVDQVILGKQSPVEFSSYSYISSFFAGKKGSDNSNSTNRHRLAFTMNYGKLGSNRFPSKCLNIVLDFHRIHRNLFFSHMENFKVEIQSGVFCIISLFPEFAVSIDLWKNNNLGLKACKYFKT